MVVSPVEPRNKNDCAGEGQQQFGAFHCEGRANQMLKYELTFCGSDAVTF
jgi:hypothetical protein